MNQHRSLADVTSSFSYFLFQGADQHVNAGANIHAAAPERRGT